MAYLLEFLNFFNVKILYIVSHFAICRKMVSGYCVSDAVHSSVFDFRNLVFFYIVVRVFLFRELY